ncbi:MAG: diacylglycerol kinase family lipid kinase [Thermogemmatispora sp.]|uniref:diacylglycerol/lipid kinase family protein n=1 Tax=Thermogemmatispora sp. TaxID=1968838 RepID=UPI002632F313|nr:diacylglycerol kinase family protein [Thermogemmatispora sp.]MBX5457136.1 diacylglycerol kinase family lipid kinase [Thermogemmatispora sp.]
MEIASATSPSSSTANRPPLVILNPTANQGRMQRHRTLVRQRAAAIAGADYCETARAGEAEELACEAARQGRPVIVVGGDGSVHEVVNGILSSGRRVPLGIIAAGSGNDFACNTLRLPRQPEAAIERAFSGQPVPIDAGQANERYFANSFSVGLDADIAASARQLKKIPFMTGMRLYYSSTVRQLLFGYRQCPWLRFSLEPADSEAPPAETFQRYVLLAVTNGPTYGSGFRINPKADASDGLLDLCTIRYAPLGRALRLLPVVKRGQHAHLPEVHFYRIQGLIIESRLPLNAQMDGEVFHGQRFEVTVLPQALLVRC